MARRTPAFAVLALLASAPAAAEAPIELAEEARVVAVIDGDTLRLDDGRQVRLIGIQAPKLPLGRPDFDPWPLSAEAREALEALALGRPVVLGYGGRRIDRHGRVLAHLFLAETAAGEGDGWLQGALLEQGLARVYSFADNRALIGEMLARERRARAAGRGIWALDHYRIRGPEGLAGRVGSFQIVEGTVREAAKVRGRVYLNFGADWRRDFTVSLAPAVRRRFEAEGIDPLAYGGRRVRVRGWIRDFNGPLIEASHPEQIEVLRE